LTGIVTHLIEVFERREVLYQLTRQQLTLRYRRTFLGYLWTLVNPLLMMSVTALVFSSLFNTGLKNYAIFLFAGMIPWTCFSSTLIQSSSSFINNEALLKKVYLPKLIFPLSVSLGVLIDSVLSIFAMSLIIVVLGGDFSFSVFLLPIAYLLLFLFGFGLALILSVVTTFFRDLQHIVVVAMQAWMFLTPVFYKGEALSGLAKQLILLNPIVPFIDIFRDLLYFARFPSVDLWLSASILAIVSISVGLVVFFLNENKIIFRL